MTRDESNLDDAMSALLRTASDLDRDRALPDEPHVIDDEGLLDDWSGGRISREQHAQAIAHLSRCHECRRILGDLLAADALELPADPFTDQSSRESDTISTEEQSVAANEGPRPIQPKSNRYFRNAAAFVIAVVAIVLVMVVFYRPGGGALTVQDVENRWEQGDARGAFEGAEALLSGDVEPADRRRLAQFLVSSGLELGEQALKNGRSDEIRQLRNTFETHDVESVDMDLLSASALVGASTRNFPPAHTRLDDPEYGFLLDGTSAGKALILEPKLLSEDREEAFGILEKAVQQHADNAQLRINYGQLLLEKGMYAAALSEFKEGLKTDPTNINGLLGKGIAAVNQKQPEAAIEAFQGVLERLPDHLEAKVNLGVAYEQAGKSAEAQHIWRQLLDGDSADEELREEIRQHLEMTPTAG